MCWWMMSWIDKSSPCIRTKSTNYWLLVQMLYHWATRESWFTKFSFLYYYICIICHMVLHVHVHPLNYIVRLILQKLMVIHLHVHYLKCIFMQRISKLMPTNCRDIYQAQDFLEVAIIVSMISCISCIDLVWSYLFLLNLVPTQADIGKNVARFVPFWTRQRNGKSRGGD